MAIFLAVAVRSGNGWMDGYDVADLKSRPIEILARWTIESNLDELGPKIRALLHKFNEHRLMPANSACVWSPTDTLSRWEIAA